MAKKQTIVLLHGNTKLTGNTAGLIQGEVAVYNASAATDVELYATDVNGNLATFQTAAKTAAAISEVASEASANKGNISTLSGNVATISGDVATISGDVATISGDVATLKTTVADHKTRLEVVEELVGVAEDGDGEKTSLVDRVGQLESDIETKLNKSAFNTYTAATNTTLGTLATKAELTGTTETLNAAISGVSANLTALSGTVGDVQTTLATKVSQTEFNTYTGNTQEVIDTLATKASVSALTTETNGKFAAVNLQIGEITESIGNLDTEVARKLDKTTFEDYKSATTETLNSKVDNNTYSLKVAALEGEDARLAGLISGNTTSIGENVVAIAALQSATGSLSTTKLDKTTFEAYQKTNNDAVAAAKTVVTGPTEGKVTVSAAQDETTGAWTYTVATDGDIASAVELQSVKANVTRLQGSDTDKSVREIAASEVAKVVAEAPEDLNTLEEIAAYIASDKTHAAEINTSISNLNKALAGYTDADAVATKFAAIDKAVSDEKAAREEADTKFTQVLAGYTTENSVKNAIEAAAKAGTDAQATADSALALAQDNSTTLAGHGTNIATLQGQITGKVETTDFEQYKSGAAADIKAAKTVVNTKNEGFVQVTKTVGTDGQDVYTVTESDIASATTLQGVKATADSAVQKIIYTDAAGTPVALTGTTIDLSGIVIDGGTY